MKINNINISLLNEKKVNIGWYPFLSQKEVYTELKKIDDKLSNEKYYPKKEDVLRFLNNSPKKNKYIIVGMDPYPQDYEVNINGKNQLLPVATGRSFEPANYDSWLDKTSNLSINNILKTIFYTETSCLSGIDDIRLQILHKCFKILPPHEWFDYMESQGVLFLNYALTVKPGKPNSHTQIWEKFSQELIKYIDSNYEVTWFLWGENAQQLEKFIAYNKIIKDSHPVKNDFYTNNKSFKILRKEFKITG